jgi:hypothetical protein
LGKKGLNSAVPWVETAPRKISLAMKFHKTSLDAGDGHECVAVMVNVASQVKKAESK